MKKLFPLFVLALISLYSCNNKAKEKEADVIKTTLTKVGQQVPEFSFVTLNNDTLSINDLKGKVVFMNFFATWCPICIKELPFIKSDIWEKYKDNKNFELLVFGREHSAEEIISFKKKKGYLLNFVPDPERKIYSLFAERYIPRNVVLNREGKIIYQSTGFDDKEFTKLKETIESELNKQ